jgi:hypothetical protein
LLLVCYSKSIKEVFLLFLVMVNSGLIEWLERNKNKGYSPQQLKDYLVKYGYTEKDVDEAIWSFSSAKPEPQKVSPPKPTIKQVLQPGKPRYRNIWLMFILLFVTCGVYGIIWYWRSSHDVQQTTGLMPRRGWLIPSVIICLIMGFITLLLFTANQIDTKASNAFVDFGSVIFVGFTIVLFLFLATFFWTYSVAIESVIETPPWLSFILLITIFPSIIIMYMTQTKLNVKAV